MQSTQSIRRFLRSIPCIDRAVSLARGTVQTHQFTRLAKRYIPHGSEPDDYCESSIRSRLVAKAHERRSSLAVGKESCVLAMGASDSWEQYGLWPAFAKHSQFRLVHNSSDHSAAGSEKLGAVRRKENEQRFMAALEEEEKGKRVVTHAFFYCAGYHISTSLLTHLNKRGIWTIVLALDDKHQFFRHHDPATGMPHQLRVAATVDLYWTTWKFGTAIVKAHGGTPWYAAEGADPERYRPVDVPRDIDLLFLGQAYGTRLSTVRFLEHMGLHVECYGKGWRNGFVSLDKMIELFSRARIVLGIGGVLNMKCAKHLKARDFEVPMAGAVYLTSYNPELSDFFHIGQDILCYGSLQECAETASWILAHPLDADAIRANARQCCETKHTWANRIHDLFSLFPPCAVN
jgi:hypothetical protein